MRRVRHGDKLSSLVKTYTPIFPDRRLANTTKEKVVEDKEATSALKEAWEKKKIAAEAKGEEFSNPNPNRDQEGIRAAEEWTTANNDKPIWVRSPKDVEEESYNEFFKSTFKEFSIRSRTRTSPSRAIPSFAPSCSPGHGAVRTTRHDGQVQGDKLFVRRVFISDEFDESLLPRYLTFVRGVVDSSDLTLNVSREGCKVGVVRIIRKRLIRKTFDMLREIAGRDNDEYDTFWDNFGRTQSSASSKTPTTVKDLAEPLFTTSKSGDQGALRSLDEYVNDMPEGQNSIYFVAADNKDAAEASPFLEKLKQKGFEVLYLLDPTHEVAMANLATHQGKTVGRRLQGSARSR